MLARVLAGDDPAAERANRRREMTVADLLRHTLATHWRVKAKPSTIKNFASTIEHSLIPEFGVKRLSELTRSQIRGWHARQTHRPRQANLDLAFLRKALNLAVGDELIKENVASGIQPHPERSRDRIPSDQELAAVLDALDAAAVRPAGRPAVQALVVHRLSNERMARRRMVVDRPGGQDAAAARRQGRSPAGRAVKRCPSALGGCAAHEPLRCAQ